MQRPQRSQDVPKKRQKDILRIVFPNCLKKINDQEKGGIVLNPEAEV